VAQVDLRQVNTIKDMPVLDLETGTVLGRVVSWIIHPRDQRVAAFLLDRSFPLQKWPVIVPADIAEYGPKMIIARNKDVIIPSQEVIGLPELIKHKMTITGFKAETASGKTLGIVGDAVFDTITSRVQKYYIRPRGLTGVIKSELVLPASKVVSIQKRRLIFADDVTALETSSASRRAGVPQRV